MDEKKVREAIELIKQEIQILEDIGSYGGIIEGKIKKHIELYNTVIEALEKQLPKKLTEHHYEEPGEMPYVKYGCGNGCRIQPARSSKYCNQCGQKIDWSE